MNCICSELNNQFPQTVNVYNEQLLIEMLSDAEILTDAERLERSMGEIISNKMNYRLNWN